ncbi:hypothetical protein F2P81_021084 [Scophthalmus maximus]|uniref:Uncharacterized protein n=1 Tax=Scophthalmus maximus TaxID=52904 RepID=A0A6A4S0A9_SCOMX|nr:hypothetical protein F2P81_021084 [Scophthalmus maximus]
MQGAGRALRFFTQFPFLFRVQLSVSITQRERLLWRYTEERKEKEAKGQPKSERRQPLDDADAEELRSLLPPPKETTGLQVPSKRLLQQCRRTVSRTSSLLRHAR